jgi:hypothetical protein
MFTWKQRKDGSWNGYFPEESGNYIVSVLLQCGYPYRYFALTMEGEIELEDQTFATAEEAKTFVDGHYNEIKQSVENQRATNVMVFDNELDALADDTGYGEGEEID